jgi:hypothetical protein
VRVDQGDFAAANAARFKEPRYVVQLVYAVGSPSFTSDRDITGIPGTVIEGSLQSISSVSQTVVPEEGRATIGGATIKIVDIGDSANFTDVVRAQLLDENAGLREREVRIWVGYSDDFADFVRVWTTYVQAPAFDDGVYTLTCADKSRALRRDVFDIKKTRLTTAITATATTINVFNTDGFLPIYHGAQYSDAPLSTVGYIKLKQSGEIIRYTGVTSTSFTGCTRGLFGTTAKAVTFDAGGDQANFPEVQEFIYLDLPGPWMAVAILTGRADPLDASKVLPEHWHLGMHIDDDLRLDDFAGAGADLYDPADVSAGFPIRFSHLTKTDGKRFLEREVYQLLGAYSPVYQDGRLGFRRANRVVSQSGWVARIDWSTVVDHGGITHDQSAVINQVQVDWNYDGEEYTRRTFASNSLSIATHGAAAVRDVEFRGLHGARHTERAIKQLVNTVWDRYSAPPIRLSATLIPPLNTLEIGDVVFVDLPDVPDYTAVGGHLSRPMEVQQVGIDWVTGRVQVQLFASPSDLRALEENAATTPILPNGWYTSAGTNLASLAGYSAGSLTANATLVGHLTDVNQASATWYHDGDLTIGAGVVLTVQRNVQLRIRGFLTVNGKIDGKGRGRTGGTDTTLIGSAGGWLGAAGSPGILGASRSGDGIIWRQSGRLRNTLGRLEQSRYFALPVFQIGVEAGALRTGVTDLRGSGGPSGAPLYSKITALSGSYDEMVARGGAGGTGGAGLLIVSRGLGFGLNGVIDLSGNDGAVGETAANFSGYNPGTTSGFQAGSGAGGGPGALVVYLDGDSVPYPDLAGHFVATLGACPIPGNPAKTRDDGSLVWQDDGIDNPLQGIHDPAYRLSGTVLSDAAYRIQYVPASGTPEEDQPALPPTATDLFASGNIGYVDLAWTIPPGDWDVVEVYQSTTNDRAFATEVLEATGSSAQHPVPVGGTGYYWIRTRRRESNQVSGWFPASATAGVAATAQSAAGVSAALDRTKITTIGGALNSDPGFQDTAIGPERTWVQVTGTGALADVSGPAGPRVYQASAPAFVRSNNLIPVDATKTYRARVVFRDATPAGARLFVFLQFYNAAGGNLAPSSAAAAGWISAALDAYTFVETIPTSSWQPAEIIFGANGDAAIPAAARSMRIAAQLHQPVSGSGTGLHQVQDLRIDEVVGPTLLRPEAVEPRHLIADLILATLIRTAGTGFRVELEGGAELPIWAGTGTKGNAASPGAGALFWLDQVNGKLVIRGTLEASRIKPDASNVLPVAIDDDTFAPIASRVIGGNYTDSGIGTSFVSLTTGVLVKHPGNGSGLDGKRLQSAQQPILLGWRVTVWNGTGAARTLDVAIQYNYDGGTWTDLDGYGSGIVSQRVVPNGRPAYLEDYEWVKPKASGWTSTLNFRIRLKVDSSAAGFETCGVGLECSIFNLGAVDDVAVVLDDG